MSTNCGTLPSTSKTTKPGYDDHLDTNKLYKGKPADPASKTVTQKHGTPTRPPSTRRTAGIKYDTSEASFSSPTSTPGWVGAPPETKWNGRPQRRNGLPSQRYADFVSFDSTGDSAKNQNSGQSSGTAEHGSGPILRSQKHARIQHGLSTDLAAVEYERLVLTLQSPLPNEQDMAISVCTLLSNDTKHVLVLPKCPQLLNLLLAHVGIYNHCGLRELTEETYLNGRGLSHARFWRNSVPLDFQEVLCERFVCRRTQHLDLHECPAKKEDCDADSFPPNSSIDTTADVEINDLKQESVSRDSFLPPKNEDEVTCCSNCPCAQDLSLNYEEDFIVRKGQMDSQIEDRIHQIATILRNLSFEEYNAEVMAGNPTFLRYLLVSMNCENPALSASSWDIIGNVARFMTLNEPMQDPLSAMIFSLVSDGLFSVDRNRVLRSLETINNWCRVEANEPMLLRYFERKVYSRICQILTISDIMLLIYTLECILSITALSEVSCNEIAHVQGSVTALISLVTVEAQSYGPKGCILMRVVETVTGNPQHSLAFQAAKKQLLKQSDQAANQGTGCLPQQTLPTSTLQGQPTPVSPNTNSPQSTSSAHQITSTVKASHPQGCNSLSSNNHAQTSEASSTSAIHAASKWTPGGIVSHVQGANQHNLTTPTLPSTGSSAPVEIPPPAVSPVPSSSPVSPTNPLIKTAKAKTRAQQKQTTAGGNDSVSNANVQSASPSVTSPSCEAISAPGSAGTTNTQPVPAQPISTVTPIPTSISLITSRGTLSEDGWAMAWLKGSFDLAVGTSIEQGEIYRMYCAARKNPNVVLSMDQFIHCVKCAYGTSVGPVIKQFGSSSLSFLEGIRPKMTLQNVSAGSALPVPGNALIINPSFGSTSSQLTQLSTPATVTPANQAAAMVISPGVPDNISGTGSNIPSSKSLSPILKATLSQPPKPKVAAGSKRPKKSTSRGSSRVVGESVVRKPSTSIVCPTSSAIRSLLASKVTQRQQKKLQPDEKRVTTKGTTDNRKKIKNCRKSNGIDGALVPDETSASSSINSTASTDSVNLSRPLSFHGILHNGLNSEDSSKDSDLAREEDDIKNQNKMKGMLVDLLEKKVKPRETVNGVVANREIRISDKGLELVDKLLDADGNNSNSSTSNASVMSNSLAPMGNDTLNSVFNAVIEGSNSSQQMTFYSSSESQLGIKRPHASDDLSEGQQPPKKLILSNGTDTPPAPGLSPAEACTTVALSCPTLKETMNKVGNISTPKTSGQSTPLPNHVTSGAHETTQTIKGSPVLSNATENSVALCTSAASASTVTSTSFAQSPMTSPGGVVQVPLRFSVNPSNSNQLTFARQFVIPPGQQFVWKSGGGSNEPMQGQVILSKPSNSSNDSSIPKAIIILQQPQRTSNLPGGSNTNPPQVQVLYQTTSTATTVTTTATTMTSNAAIGAPTAETVNTMTVSTASVQSLSTFAHKSGSSGAIRIPNPTPDADLDATAPYLCEWTGCGLRFGKYQEVYYHAARAHCPESLQDAVRCEWGTSRCDPTLRKRLSLMTHLQDRHCSKPALELSIFRRKSKIDFQPPPAQPIQHPGYAPNAAFHAIKRHAVQYTNPKELLDDNEGPVTKSIRLTASLILKNICLFSAAGRRILREHESILAGIAMSNVESSRTIAQVLFELSKGG